MNISVTTATTIAERSWLELGMFIGALWAPYFLMRYPYNDPKLKISRDTTSWADGNGRHQETEWRIDIPQDYQLFIAKVYADRLARTYEILFDPRAKR